MMSRAEDNSPNRVLPPVTPLSVSNTSSVEFGLVNSGPISDLAELNCGRSNLHRRNQFAATHCANEAGQALSVIAES
jgi:hypothetical protein